MPSSVPSEIPQPGSWRRSASRQRGTQGVEDRAAPLQLVGGRDRGVVADAERVALCPHLVERLDVDEVAVVAEEVAGTVGDRTDDGDPASRRGEREDAIVGDEHQGAAGEVAGDPRLVGGEGVEVVGRGHLDVWPLEQPEAELEAQHPGDRRIDRRLVDATVVERLGERRPVRRGARQLGVDAGHQREPGRLPEVAGQAVGRGQHLDGDVVGRDDAVEAPLIAQDRAEELGRGVARDPVDVAVGGHHRGETREPDRRLEREQLLVAQLARPDMGGRHVHPALGQAVPDHVLAGRRDAVGQRVALQRHDVRAAQLGREIRVLAVRLLDATPARIAPDVEDRAQGMSCAGHQHPPADGRGDLADERSVERGGGADRLLEARRGPRQQPVQALLVDDGRDAEPRLLDEEALDGVGRLGDLDRAEVRRAGEPRQLAQAVLGEDGEALAVEPVVTDHLERPERPELGQLLRAGHPPEQVRDPLVDRPRRIAVGRGADGFGRHG